MATILTHAVVAVGLGKLFTGRRMPWRFWAWAAGLAVLPDADVVMFRLGVPYDSPLGHRGFSHSLLFALLAGAAVAGATYRSCGVGFGDLWGFFFVVTASHGLLDACTDGGEGIAFFWPFTDDRFFLPDRWRVLRVSMIGRTFIADLWANGPASYSGRTLLSELVWVWLPTAGLVGAVTAYRRLAGRRSTPA